MMPKNAYLVLDFVGPIKFLVRCKLLPHCSSLCQLFIFSMKSYEVFKNQPETLPMQMHKMV